MGEGIRERIEQVRRRIAEAAGRSGRNPDDVQIVAVTKTVAVPQVREALDAGLKVFGENRVQEAKTKVVLLNSPSIRWHLVGHLQTNKSQIAVELFDLIHSLDSVKLAAILDRHGAALRKRVRALIEVNLGGESDKSGIRESELLPFLQGCRAYAHLTIEGLMAIPPLQKNPQDVRPFFRRLRLLRDQAGDIHPDHRLRHLSMGMSNDFEVAIEEGATLVRIGTAIFGDRVKA